MSDRVPSIGLSTGRPWLSSLIWHLWYNLLSSGKSKSYERDRNKQCFGIEACSVGKKNLVNVAHIFPLSSRSGWIQQLKPYIGSFNWYTNAGFHSRGTARGGSRPLRRRPLISRLTPVLDRAGADRLVMYTGRLPFTTVHMVDKDS